MCKLQTMSGNIFDLFRLFFGCSPLEKRVTCHVVFEYGEHLLLLFVFSRQVVFTALNAFYWLTKGFSFKCCLCREFH